MSDIYDPAQDDQMQKPFIDIKEQRSREGIEYIYCHGGFGGTDIKFSLYFPMKDKYEGRFFQYLPPFANHEDSSQKLTQGDDKILFSLLHGAYFVESNLGTLNPFAPATDVTINYRSSSAVAEYSRKIAIEIYGDHITRPSGYIFGGSGGAYKTIDCVEHCRTWDGCVPYVNGIPVSVPHNMTIRAHSMRILRRKLDHIIASLQPDGCGDMYDGLSEYEKEALDDLLAFGFPKGAICGLKFLKDGSLPVLIGGIKGNDPGYFEDFWNVEGYAGYDKKSDAYESRIHHKTKVSGKFVPLKGEAKSMDNTTGVDTSWQRYKGLSGALGVPLLQVETMATNDFYEMGCFVNFLSGKAAGKRIHFNEHKDNVLCIGEYFQCDDMIEILNQVEIGDEVLLDNSDYIASTDYHLHAIPKGNFAGFDRAFNSDGKPKYAQREKVVNFTGCCEMTGTFSCKMIIEHTFCDESAFPYQGDWYKKLVYKAQGESKAKQNFRLQYMDNALHDDRADPVDVELQYVTNAQCVFQCLLDVANWVEKGIEPPKESQYNLKNGGQLLFSKSAIDRGGIQNVCSLNSNGKKSIRVKKNMPVEFTVDVEIPTNCGVLTNVEWSFEGEKNFPVKTGKCKKAVHSFENEGKYVVVVRTYNERNGDDKSLFTQIRNIDRMVVNVE